MTLRLFLCFGLFLASPPALGESELRERASEEGLSWPPPEIRVEIDKSDRTLDLYSGKHLLKRYPVSLGFSPVGDKAVEGDGRTPTGEFRVVTRNPNSSFYRFMGISYPTSEDAQRGLRERLISPAQAQQIREADSSRRQPPWNTALGGAIGIHGSGSRGDWTLGCIALTNAHMKEIWDIGRLGMTVKIQE